MTKSIHFAPVPNMQGKLTMRFTDVVAQDLRPKELARIQLKEMRDWEADAAPDRSDDYEAALSDFEELQWKS